MEIPKFRLLFEEGCKVEESIVGGLEQAGAAVEHGRILSFWLSVRTAMMV